MDGLEGQQMPKQKPRELKIRSPQKSGKLSRARRVARLEEVGEDREVEGLTVEKGGEEVERITGRF